MEVIAIGQEAKTIAILESLRLKVTTADDGLSGIRKIIDRSADFAVVEMDMPHLNGINLAKILGLLELNVPLIFTAKTDRYRARMKSFGNTVEYVLHSEVVKKITDNLMVRIPRRRRDSTGSPFFMSRTEWENLFSRPGRKRLLFVEDDPEMTLLVTSLVGDPEEFEMFTAKDGLEGLRKAVAVNPDLIIADIDMPILDGLSMSQILYILGKPFPIVFLTSMDNNELVNKARHLDGVLGYMLKHLMDDTIGFTREIKRHLKMGQLALETSVLSYERGNLEPLTKTGTGHGVLWLE